MSGVLGCPPASKVPQDWGSTGKKKGVQRAQPFAEGLGVSPNFTFSPKMGEPEGVEKILINDLLLHLSVIN